MSVANMSFALLRFPITLLRGRNGQYSTPLKPSSRLREGLNSRSSLWVIAGTAIVFSLVVTLWSRSQRSTPNPLPRGVVAEVFAPGIKANQRGANPAPSSISVETVTLTPRGFEPTEITPANKFLLGIDNRIIGEALFFELVRENGHKAHELKMAKGQIRLRKLLNLRAGRYTLQVMDHPEWRCNIVVSN